MESETKEIIKKKLEDLEEKSKLYRVCKTSRKRAIS